MSTTFELQVCHDPQQSPASYETVGTFNTASDAITRYEEFSQMYRVGKMFQVVDSRGFVDDIHDLIDENLLEYLGEDI